MEAELPSNQNCDCESGWGSKRQDFALEFRRVTLSN